MAWFRKLLPFVLLSACGGDPPKTEPKTAPAKAVEAPKGTDAPAPTPAPPPDPWTQLLDARPLATSGLGVGARLQPFDARGTNDEVSSCPVCDLQTPLTVLAVGRHDDPTFRADLQDLDALVYKYGPKSLSVLGVLTSFDDERAVTPSDPDALVDEAKQLRKTLRLERSELFVPVPPSEDAEHHPHRVWDEYYNVTQSRTFMLADRAGRVVWSGTGGEDFFALNEAIRSALPKNEVPQADPDDAPVARKETVPRRADR